MRVKLPWYHSVVVVSVLGLSIPVFAAPGGQAQSSRSSALLSEAYKQTADGDMAAAEATYREMLKCCPDEGYPALARFLNRTGQTTAVETLLRQDAGLAAQPVLTRARSFISAGMRGDAVELLKMDSGSSGSLYARTLLLSNQLETLGENAAAAAEIERALTSPELADADRRDLFLRLLNVGGPEHLAGALPALVDSVVTSSSISYPQVRAMAVDGLTVLSMGPGYADFHAKLEQAAKSSPSQAWLYALSCIKKGDDATAVETMDRLSTATMSPRQQAICLEELARMVSLDTPRAIALYEAVIPLSDDPDRIRLNLAQQHFRAKDFARAVEMLKPMKFEELHEGDQQMALNLYLTSLGAQGPMKELVAEFLRLSKDLPYAKVRDIAPAPFLMFSPDNLQALRMEVDRVTKESTGTENAYVLLMGLENQIGNQDGVAQALQMYTSARQDEVNAVHELADALAAKAWKLVADNPETSPPLAELERVGNAASKALWDAVRMRPYAPEPYEKLIALYSLYNQPDKARDVPKFLSERPNATAEEIHLAAYIYATNGYPELSLPLYERALKLNNEARYRLNYAAALGRVGRFNDALRIYRDIIEHGVNGHHYHIHQVHLSALMLARKAGQEQEHVAFLHRLRKDQDTPDRAEFLVEEGKVLASAGLYDEALEFFYQYKQEFPGDSQMATDIIVSTYVAKGDFDTARKLLNDEVAKASDPKQIAFLRNNYALTYRLQGQVDAAVAEWQKLAADLPNEQLATQALLNAARALAQSGRIEQASQFYKQFVQLNTGDVNGEQIARDELERLGRMEVPTDMLVQSAILEYGPGNEDHDHGYGFDHFDSQKKEPDSAGPSNAVATDGADGQADPVVTGDAGSSSKGAPAEIPFDAGEQ